MKKLFPIFVSLSSSFLSAAEPCPVQGPASCNLDSCEPCYCLGPSAAIANAPVRPVTCDGDFTVSAGLLYWVADQDGMEYAYTSNVIAKSAGSQRNEANLVDAVYKTPKFKANFGFRFGFDYASPCDGWDVGLFWTQFYGKGNSHDQVQTNFKGSAQADDDPQVLVVLLSAYATADKTFTPPLANNIVTSWKPKLDIVDLFLGRDYWVSRLLSMHPYISLRYASIQQDYDLLLQGGVWEADPQPTLLRAHNDEVQIQNDFKGIGPSIGFDLNFHFGCGWSVYTNLAAAILYGRFDIDQNEFVRKAEAPFDKTKILETEDHFRCSRAAFDLALGVQWAALICDCKYGVSLKLGWEQHLYYAQNQFWAVQRIEDNLETLPNDTGENVFAQRRGNLGTRGVTLTAAFDF